MKVVNKIMIGIAVLCLLLCGGIMVFALNPDMTSSLAQKLYGNTVDMPPGTEETGEGQTSGNGNISVTLPNGMPGEMNGYVAPSMDQMQIPEDVSGRTGFTPVQPEEQQIPDQEAQNLKETLGSGETGGGAVIFRRGVSVLSDVVGESAVRIPADLCQRTEPDGKVCTGEDRVCQ